MMRTLDISRPLRNPEDILCQVPAELPLYEGFACEEYRHEFRSHTGCYFETSAHLFRDGTVTDDVPVEQLFMPTLVARLAPNRRGAIEPEEIENALVESVNPGDALIVDTGATEGRHFARPCGPWLAEREASLLAASLTRYDTGFEPPTGIFVELFRAGIPILAGIQNLGQIEHERAFLIVLPLRIERVCTTPCRAVVLDGERWEVQLLTKLLRPDLVVPNRVG
jgi:kynurenine formamidase